MKFELGGGLRRRVGEWMMYVWWLGWMGVEGVGYGCVGEVVFYDEGGVEEVGI